MLRFCGREGDHGTEAEKGQRRESEKAESAAAKATADKTADRSGGGPPKYRTLRDVLRQNASGVGRTSHAASFLRTRRVEGGCRSLETVVSRVRASKAGSEGAQPVRGGLPLRSSGSTPKNIFTL